MSFLPFVFKKDFIRLQWLFVVWLLLIMGQAALGIGGIKIAAQLLEFQIILPLLTKLMDFLQGMLIIVMIPLIIQEDSLVGTTAFWFTRPISRKDLLTTKACFIFLLLIALPLFAEIFVLAANKITLHHILLAIPEILLEKYAFAVPLVMLAVLTPKFSRYALTGISVFAILAVIGIFISVIQIFVPVLTQFLLKSGIRYFNPSLDASLKVVKDIFVITIGSFLITHQFLTRNTARTVRWLVVGYLLMLCLEKTWQWDFLQQPSLTKEISVPAESLKVDFDSHHAIISDELRYRVKDTREKSISLKENIHGLPTGHWAILSDLKNVSMKFPDGDTLKSKYVSTKRKETFANEKFMAPLQSALKNVTLLNPFQENSSYTEIFSLAEADFNRYKNKKGTYFADGDIDLYTYKIVARIPLKQRAGGAFDSEQIVIYDILGKPDGISVIIGEKKTNLLFDRTAERKSRLDLARNIYSDFDHVYLIVNEKRGQAFLAEFGGNLFANVMTAYGPTRLETKAKRFDFHYVNDRNGPLPEIDKTWLTDAELIRLDAQKAGTSRINLQLTDFVLPAQSTEGSEEIDAIDAQLRRSDKEFEEQREKWDVLQKGTPQNH